MVFVREHQSGIDASGGNERGQFFTAETSAGHQAAADLLVAHAAAPFDPRDLDVIAAAEIIDRAYDAAGFDHADGFIESVDRAAGDADAVHALAVRQVQDLFGQIAVLVAQETGGAVGRRDLAAFGAGADAVDIGRAAESRRSS